MRNDQALFCFYSSLRQVTILVLFTPFGSKMGFLAIFLVYLHCY